MMSSMKLTPLGPPKRNRCRSSLRSGFQPRKVAYSLRYRGPKNSTAKDRAETTKPILVAHAAPTIPNSGSPQCPNIKP